MRDLDKFLEKCPKLKALIESKKEQPTDSQRIEALEAAVGELAVMVATKGADGNA